MLGLAVWCKRRDQSVLKPTLDDLMFVGSRFADADIDFMPAVIDRHVAMAGAMMFGPALDEIGFDGEDECLICEVDERLLAEYVAAQRRDPAIMVPAGKLRQINVREFLTTSEIRCKFDE